MLLLASPAPGQRYETTIPLPDPLSGIGHPRHLSYNETSDRMYVAGWESGGVVAFDGTSHRKVGHWDTGYRVADMVWGRTHNRVYTADYAGNTVTVADGQTGHIVATISGSLEHPYSLMLDESRNKMYVACDYYIAVVSLATNAVTKTIPIPDLPMRMMPDSARNRYIVAGFRDSLYLVDADADTVTRVIPLPPLRYQGLLALNTRDDKLYCTGALSEWVAVVDLATGSMVDSVAVPYDPNDIVWNVRENLLYVASHDPGLTVIDCEGDSVLAALNIFSASDIELDTTRNRLYVCSSPPGESTQATALVVVDCGSQAIIAVIRAGYALSQVRWIPGNDVVYITDGERREVMVYNCATLTELARSEVGTKPAGVAWNSINRQLYTANARSSCISVIDGNTLVVADTIGVSQGPHDLCWVPENNKLYCTTQRDLDIWIIDGNTNEPVARLPGRDLYNHMAFSRTSNKLYCSHYTSFMQDSGLVTVVDGTTNEIVATITTGPSTTRLFWYADSNWMYCTRYRSIAVIDCETDRVMTTITDVRGPTEMVFNPTNNSIYCASADGLLIIDAPTRWIRKRLYMEMVYPIAWNSRRNVVYVSAAGSGELSVIDCATDSVVAVTRYEPEGYPVGILWNHLNDKVYLLLGSWENTLVVFDAGTNQVVDMLTMRGWPSGIAWDPMINRTFVSNWEGSSVSVLRDDLPGVGEAGGVAARARPAGPTIVRGVLALPRDMSLGTRSVSHPMREPALPERNSVLSRAALLDISGRKVMELTPGDNDIRHLAPGVYFVRQASGVVRDASSVHKVIIQR
ncbi:MAG: hypothetical protein R6X12_08235 [bacterium]